MELRTRKRRMRSRGFCRHLYWDIVHLGVCLQPQHTFSAQCQAIYMWP